MVIHGTKKGEIRFKLMSGQDFANTGQTYRQTDGQTVNMRPNIKRQKVPSGKNANVTKHNLQTKTCK